MTHCERCDQIVAETIELENGDVVCETCADDVMEEVCPLNMEEEL